jgi:hypothetical protein
MVPTRFASLSGVVLSKGAFYFKKILAHSTKQKFCMMRYMDKGQGIKEQIQLLGT